MFTSPKHYSSTKPVELFATLALALSTLVAVTVVSIGIARADGLRAVSTSVPAIAVHGHSRQTIDGLASRLSMIFSENRFPLFGIML
jgi:hypothetical protein